MANEKILKELYCGNLIFSNSMTYKTKEYLKASHKSSELGEQLEDTLDDKQKNLLDELLESKDVMTDEMVYGAFKDGFKLGMGLTVEGLRSDDADEN
ncbi:MAG: hypothetical protein OSJ43_15790 [Oscillospiraceae bacterium]|nr:hypothetical protein [Oscillospiraceae bacterium]